MQSVLLRELSVEKQLLYKTVFVCENITEIDFDEVYMAFYRNYTAEYKALSLQNHYSQIINFICCSKNCPLFIPVKQGSNPDG